MKSKRRPSLAEVARVTGVSTATVSRVLNSRPGIAEETREKVLEQLQAHGFPRHPVKGGMQTLKNGISTIAYATDSRMRTRFENGDSFYLRHLIAIQSACSAYGFYPLLVNCEEDLSSNGSLKCVEEGRVLGVVAENMPDKLIARLKEQVGVVLFNMITPVSGVDYIVPNVQQAAREQLIGLYNRGHRSIACFRPLPATWQNQAYWSEFWGLGMKMGFYRPPEFFQPIVFPYDEDTKTVSEFLDRVLAVEYPPTAIVSGDKDAVILYEELMRRGIRVPAEVSLVGFDDRRDSDLPIPMSTFRQDFNAMACEALRALVDRCKDRQFPTRVIHVEGKTIFRESVIEREPIVIS